MSLLSSLRKKLRQHDEKLAERTYRDGGARERAEDASLASVRSADIAVDEAVQAEDAREHEEPE